MSSHWLLSVFHVCTHQLHGCDGSY